MKNDQRDLVRVLVVSTHRASLALFHLAESMSHIMDSRRVISPCQKHVTPTVRASHYFTMPRIFDTLWTLVALSDRQLRCLIILVRVRVASVNHASLALFHLGKNMWHIIDNPRVI